MKGALDGAATDDLVAYLSDLDTEPFEGERGLAILGACQQIAAAYASLLAQGLPDEAIARAMLGATISFYDIVGLAPVLPLVLQNVGDKLASRQVLAH